MIPYCLNAVFLAVNLLAIHLRSVTYSFAKDVCTFFNWIPYEYGTFRSNQTMEVVMLSFQVLHTGMKRVSLLHLKYKDMNSLFGAHLRYPIHHELEASKNR